jgi:hypothetical protein
MRCFLALRVIGGTIRFSQRASIILVFQPLTEDLSESCGVTPRIFSHL